MGLLQLLCFPMKVKIEFATKHYQSTVSFLDRYCIACMIFLVTVASSVHANHRVSKIRNGITSIFRRKWLTNQQWAKFQSRWFNIDVYWWTLQCFTVQIVPFCLFVFKGNWFEKRSLCRARLYLLGTLFCNWSLSLKEEERWHVEIKDFYGSLDSPTWVFLSLYNMI